MQRERLTFAGEFGGLGALGLAESDALFAADGRLSDRMEALPGPRGSRRVRFPLAGTPDARGRLLERPGALAPGWVRLTAFQEPAWSELLRARLSAPRSTSLAEREWNLLCHLRNHGAGTPEPLIVGARGNGFVARRSFLLVRELEGALPFDRWLRPEGLSGLPGERERGLRSVGLFLANLERAGVLVPGLEPAHLWITPAGGECEHEEPGAPRKNHLPGVALSEVSGGRFAASTAVRAMLVELCAALAGVLTEDELAHVRDLALGGAAHAKVHAERA